VTEHVFYAFTIPGAPRGKGRPKFARRGDFVMTYTDDKTSSYENLVTLACREVMAGRPPIEGPVWLQVNATFAIPASASKGKKLEMIMGRVVPTKKPDLDNIVKAVLDGLNTVAFVDDAQVTHISAAKNYGHQPGVWVRVEAASV